MNINKVGFLINEDLAKYAILIFQKFLIIQIKSS